MNESRYVPSDCFQDSCLYGRYALLQMVYSCFMALICPLGAGLNILSIIVLLAEQNSKTAQTVFLVSLAISDSLFLLYSLIRVGVSCFVEIATDSCRFYSLIGLPSVYFRYFARMFTFWMVVVVTIHRYLAVRHPLRVRNFTAKTAIIVTGIVFTISVAVGVGLTKSLILTNTSSEDMRPTVRILASTARLSMACILPVGIVFICNTLTIIRVKNARSFRRSASVNRDNSRESANSDDPSMRIIAVSTVFLITSIPFVVYTSLFMASKSLTKPIGIVSGISLCVNSSVNFFLYFYTGTRFRAAFHRRILGRMQRNAARNSVYSRATESVELNTIYGAN